MKNFAIVIGLDGYLQTTEEDAEGKINSMVHEIQSCRISKILDIYE